MIEGKLAGSARPESEPQLNWLWNEGLRAIFCLNMECPLDDEQVKKIGFEYAFMSVRDFSARTLETCMNSWILLIECLHRITL